MFQTFDTKTEPQMGAPRLAALRKVIDAGGLDGFLVPRADAHQGEYVAACDLRLAWLTGFSGSAGFCAVLRDRAGVFVDGRYRLAVRNQVDLDVYTPVNWPEVKLGAWLIEALPKGGVVGFDPWLHTHGEMEALKAMLLGSGIEMRSVDNLVDQVWQDRPAPPRDLMVPYDVELAGVPHREKRKLVGDALTKVGQSALVITQPDAIAWLLNTRGADLGQTPVALAFAILRGDGSVTLFIESEKTDAALYAHLGNDVAIEGPDRFGPALDELAGPVLVDKSNAPIWVGARLEAAGVLVEYGNDPIALAKACKNEVEIAGTVAAHLRDGAAVCAFLCWLDGLGDAPVVSEIDVVKKLESCRAATGKLRNISFDTISGSGPNGAIIHYRVSTMSNRVLDKDSVLLVDSGAQYLDGTTDITRTIALGTPPKEAVRAFTLVLKGMISVSRARFPKGVTGRDIDPLARNALWQAGLDYDHGTGHGVGVYLGVHEGPQRISRATDVVLQAGMILSNEPGYYKAGAFGIRIENLIVVEDAPPIEGGDDRAMLCFKTLTWAPIDRRMIDINLLDASDLKWLDGYHAQVYEQLERLVDPVTLVWLRAACRPLE